MAKPMSQSLKATLSAIMAMTALTISAAGPLSTFPEEGGVYSSTSPLTQAVIEAPTSETDYGIIINSGYSATLSKDGVVVQTISSSDTSKVSVGKTFGSFAKSYITLDAISEPGSYTLSIPKGFYSYETSGSTEQLDDISINFRVVAGGDYSITPASGSEVTAKQVSSIVITYPEGTTLAEGNTSTLNFTETYQNKTTTLSAYSVRISGNKVILSASSPSALTARNTASATTYHCDIAIPEGTWTINGEACIPINLTYQIRSVTASCLTSNPAFESVTPVSVEDLRSIEITCSETLESVSGSPAILQVWDGSEWKASGVQYTLTKVSDNKIQLTPRSGYDNFSSLDGDHYRINFSAGAFKSNGVNSAAIYTKTYNVKAATECNPASISPAAGSTIYSDDLTSFTINFGSAMTLGSGEVSILKDGKAWQTIEASKLQLTSDGKGVVVNLNPVMDHDSEAHVYTISLPASLASQSAGKQLPSAAYEFTYTLAKVIKIEGAWNKKITVTPSTTGSISSFQSITLTYPGADEIILGNGEPTLSFNGTTKVTFNNISVKGNVVTLTGTATSTSLTAGGANTITIPADAWTIYSGDKAYSSEYSFSYWYWAKDQYFGSIEPAGGFIDIKEVSKSLNEFTIKHSTSKGSGFGKNTAGSGYLLKIDNGIIGSEAEALVKYNIPSLSAKEKSFVMTADSSTDWSKITEGEYVVKIPASALKSYSNPFSQNAAWTQDVMVYFVVRDNAVDITCLPASGLMLPEVSELTFTIDDCTEIKRNTSLRPTYGNVKEIVDSDGDVTQRMFTTTISGNKITAKLYPALTIDDIEDASNNEVTINIPSGIFICDGESANKAITLTYKLTTNPEITPTLYPSYSETQGTVTNISNVAIKYEDGVTPEIAANAASMVDICLTTYEKNGDESTEYLAAPLSDRTYTFSLDGSTVNIGIEPPVVTAGKYTIIIKKGALKLNGVSFPQYRGVVEVSDPAALEFSPATDTQLPELSEVTISFPNSPKSVTLNNSAYIYLTDEDGREISSDEHELSVALNSDNKLSVKISPAITELGKYTITIAEGAVTCDNVKNSERYSTYDVINPLHSDFFNSAHEISNWGNRTKDNEIGWIYYFNVSFPYAGAITADKNLIPKITITRLTDIETPESTVSDLFFAAAKSPAASAQSADGVLIKRTYAVHFQGDTEMPDTNDILKPNEACVEVQPLIYDDGIYSVNIPEGTFIVDGTKAPALNKEYIINKGIVTEVTEISDICPADGYTVYTTDGLLLMRNASVEDLGKLSRGKVYIINGCAVILR